MSQVEYRPTIAEIPVQCRQFNELGLPIVAGGHSFATPLPKGLVNSAGKSNVHWDDGTQSAVENQTLARWPDGSIRWLLSRTVDSPNSASAGMLHINHTEATPVNERSRHYGGADAVETACGDRRLGFATGNYLLRQVRSEGGPWLAEEGCRLLLKGKQGAPPQQAHVDTIGAEAIGDISTVVTLHGRFQSQDLRFIAKWTLCANSGLVKLDLSVENPSRARHKNGYWDLSDAGSTFVSELSLELNPSFVGHCEIDWQDTSSSPVRTLSTGDFEIRQESSGGENWRSRNHVDGDGKVPMPFQGYRARAGEEQFDGLRADPIVALRSAGRSIACSVPEFWQKFPTALQVQGGMIRVQLLPETSGRMHELQAGERYSQTIFFDFRDGCDNPCRQLWEFRSTSAIQVSPRWIADSKAIPFFPSQENGLRPEHHQLLQEALEGPASFLAKRETIDEYGWRNFGDVWADHEEAYYDGQKPIISHYNNQYDLLNGFLIQYLLTGDERWWQLADPLAKHIMDIDIYHTEYDKSAYSGGMFWHTAHYHDAGTSGHRSYSTQMRGKAISAPGGGPSNEHNYTSGLLLYYFMTGDDRARDAVIGLADWVISIDDGSQHLLGLVCDKPTGAASCTRDPDFHGPGRGAANSINALLDGWQATGSAHYLEKSDELIRRTIHPNDDVEARQLLEVEDRWSYTVYLQTLVRFYELTAGVPLLNNCRQYARSALLHYARWMAEHERLYLDYPELLEYPTETWAAQDLRKGNVLLHAAQLTKDPADRAKFRQKGVKILDGAWRQLMSFKTRSTARPMALALQQGWIETYLRHDADVGDKAGKSTDCGMDDVEGDIHFGEPFEFISQKQNVQSAMRSPAGWAKMLVNLARPARWRNVLRRSWIAQKFRRGRG